MTIKEIAELCAVDRRTIERWAHKVIDDPGQNAQGDGLMQNAKGNPAKNLQGLAEKLAEAEKSGTTPADFTIEETLAIIGEGGKNQTLAALLAENAASKNALAIQNNGFTAPQAAQLAALMNNIQKALENPRKAAYEELEAWIVKTLEFEDKPIHRVYVHQIYHAYRKEVENPLNEHIFKFKIALEHPEFKFNYAKSAGWYFSFCSLARVI